MSKINIKLQPLGKTIEAEKGVDLIDVLHEYGVEFPCAGNGTCGKCKIKLIEGNISINDKHAAALQKNKLDADWRLACYSVCDEDVTFEIGQYKSIILADETSFSFTPQDGYGVAVDIGTTTIVAQLLDLKTGEILGVEKAMNPQSKFGADLISRIQKAVEGKNGEMTEMIREKIGELITNLIDNRSISLEKVVIVGNTVMQHLFCNFDITPLSMYPFNTEKLGLHKLSTQELSWSFNVAGDIIFYPSIGAFVGSDILAGIVSTKLAERDEYIVLVDLGTNGEIVVGNKDKILCASTAAGPAFEGANISQGMQAVTGAISSIQSNGLSWNSNVIGNVEPKGICGSALIDAVALLQQEERIGIFGDLVSGEEYIAIRDEVKLTQQDIREFQLAKSAIAAGIELLIQELGISKDNVSEIFIAGGFGNYIDLKHVLRTGMLEFDIDKIHKFGNTALIGAKILLFEDPEFVDSILAKTTHIGLESLPAFQDIYVDKMMFQ